MRDNRDLRLLLTGGLVSVSGDYLLGVGLAYAVYALTGSTVASGLTLLSRLLPPLLFGSVAGVYADRWDRRRTMVVTNLLLAASLLPLLAVSSGADIWVVYVVSFVESTLAQFFLPAESAIVPSLVATEDLLAANAVNNQLRNVARLVGSALGGVAVGIGGLPLLVGFDAATYVGSAVLISRICAPRRPTRETPPVTGALRGMAADLRDGARVARQSPVLRTLFVFGAMTSVGEGVMGTLFAPFVRSVLEGSAGDFGAIVAAQGVGGIAGGWIVSRRGAGPLSRRGIARAAIAFGVVDLALFLYPVGYVAVWPALVFMLVVGLPGALLVAGTSTLFQTAAPDSHRGRVFGTYGALRGAGTLVGIGTASTLPAHVSIVPVIAIQGAGYVLGGLWLAARLLPDDHAEAVATSPAGASTARVLG